MTKLDWPRIVSAGLIAQIALNVVFGFVVLNYGQGTVSNASVVVAALAFNFLAAVWVGLKIESRFVLHGFLVGIVGVICHVAETLPNLWNSVSSGALSGGYGEYLLTSIGGHTPKLLGGLRGGYLVGRRSAGHKAGEVVSTN